MLIWCILYIFPFRAKEIKIKLGILLQKPESAVDLVIPYNEKPDKPVKIQKWVMIMDSILFLQRMATFQVHSTIPPL